MSCIQRLLYELQNGKPWKNWKQFVITRILFNQTLLKKLQDSTIQSLHDFKITVMASNSLCSKRQVDIMNYHWTKGLIPNLHWSEGSFLQEVIQCTLTDFCPYFSKKYLKTNNLHKLFVNSLFQKSKIQTFQKFLKIPYH